MLKTYEVTSDQLYPSGRHGRAYVTPHAAAEAAKRRAELERSGEAHRCRLMTRAERLQSELRSFRHRLMVIEEDVTLLESALKPFSRRTEELEVWIAQATLLRDGVAQILPGLETAYRERARTELLEGLRRQRELKDQEVKCVTRVVDLIRDGTRLTRDELAWTLADAELASISQELVAVIKKALSVAVRYEQIEDWYHSDNHPFTRLALTGEKMSKLFFAQRSRHSHCQDSDLRRRWRRERRRMV